MSLGLLLAAALTLGQVELRGESEPLRAPVTAVTLDGVRLGGSEPRVIGWDRVRRVRGEHEAQSLLFTEYADKAWRARTRLLRGDAPGAEPLFEELFAVYAWRRGPTAAVICEGLLRCRLRRGAVASSVVPWLSLLHAREDPHDQGLGVRPVLDATTGLSPTLPPIWLSGAAVQALALDLADPRIEELSNASGGRRIASLAEWYRAAAAFEGGAGVALPSTPGLTADSGMPLVRDVVAARIGTPEQRREARRALEARLAGSTDTWVEAWCRAGLGRSLVLEDEEELRRLGIVSLLHLPVRFADDQPHLAGVCMAEAVVALHGLGDREGAMRLLTEFQDRFPGHPALLWPPVVELLSSHGRSADLSRGDRSGTSVAQEHA